MVKAGGVGRVATYNRCLSIPRVEDLEEVCGCEKDVNRTIAQERGRDRCCEYVKRG